MKVIEYAKKHSNSKASKDYSIARKRVIEWRKAEQELSGIEEQRKRMRLSGGGRRVRSTDIDSKLKQWIQERQEAGAQVTGRAVKIECRRLHCENGNQGFKASCGWLRSFKKRNKLTF